MRDLPTSELDYPLDEACIADHPVEPRDAAKLMVVERASARVTHAHVRDLPNWLRAGDCLVVNCTRVMRARFMGARPSAVETGPARVTEGLLLEQRAAREWLALVKHAKRYRAGDTIMLTGHDGRHHGDRLHLLARDGEGWVVRLESSDDADPWRAMERSGWTPLPPYILRARAARKAAAGDDEDRAWYQTVFALNGSHAHESVAAPTAGLHFTNELVERLSAAGVGRLSVDLQVGAGTFRTVEAATLSRHEMHRERFHVPAETLAALRARVDARRAGLASGGSPTDGRLVAVGTTSVRALESLPAPLPACEPRGWEGHTELLIQPGHDFRFVDALLTNFHLPRSTLLALVGAMVGMDRLKELYADAQRSGYRFFSYGDAMLVL